MIVYTDGGCRSNPGPGAAAFVAQFQDGRVVENSTFLSSERTTNNIAEYTALLGALSFALTLGRLYEPVIILSDSELMVRQVRGQYQCKNERLIPLYEIAIEKMNLLRLAVPETETVGLNYIPRERNTRADELCNIEMDMHGVVCSRTGLRRRV